MFSTFISQPAVSSPFTLSFLLPPLTLLSSSMIPLNHAPPARITDNANGRQNRQTLLDSLGAAFEDVQNRFERATLRYLDTQTAYFRLTDGAGRELGAGERGPIVGRKLINNGLEVIFKSQVFLYSIMESLMFAQYDVMRRKFNLQESEASLFLGAFVQAPIYTPQAILSALKYEKESARQAGWHAVTSSRLYRVAGPGIGAAQEHERVRDVVREIEQRLNFEMVRYARGGDNPEWTFDTADLWQMGMVLTRVTPFAAGTSVAEAKQSVERRQDELAALHDANGGRSFLVEPPYNPTVWGDNQGESVWRPAGFRRLSRPGLRARNADGRVRRNIGAFSVKLEEGLKRLGQKQVRRFQPLAFCTQIAVFDARFTRILPCSKGLAMLLKRDVAAINAAVRVSQYSPKLPNNVLARLSEHIHEDLHSVVATPFLREEEMLSLLDSLKTPVVVFEFNSVLELTKKTAPPPTILYRRGLAAEMDDNQLFEFINSGRMDSFVLATYEDENNRLMRHLTRLAAPALLMEIKPFCAICKTRHAITADLFVFCDCCSLRMRASCQERHSEICEGVRPCGKCGLSKSPNHRCTINFAEASRESRLLCEPDDLFTGDVLMESREKRETWEVIGEAFRKIRAAPDQPHRHAKEIYALVERNVARLLPLIVAYDFETVSPVSDLEDPNFHTTTAKTMTQGVTPVVFSAIQVRPFAGAAERAYCTFVGTNCADLGADWLIRHAMYAFSTPEGQRYLSLMGFDAEEAMTYAANLAQPSDLLAEIDPDAPSHSKWVDHLVSLAREEIREKRKKDERSPEASEAELESQAEMRVLLTQLRKRAMHTTLALGFNSSRFDLPLLLPSFPLQGATSVNQGSDTFIKAVTTNGVKHCDLRLLLGGSLARNAKSFRLPEDALIDDKWEMSFEYYNSIPRARLREEGLELLEEKFPTYEGWLCGKPSTPGLQESYQRAQALAGDVWRPFEFMSHYCMVDCKVLAMLIQNSLMYFAKTVGVLPFFESSTMASTSVIANRRHERFDPKTQQVDLSPFAVKLEREVLGGGVTLMFATEARLHDADPYVLGKEPENQGKGFMLAVDAGSAYPAQCATLMKKHGLPYGYLTNVPYFVGNGARVSLDVSQAERAEVKRRLMASCRVNFEGQMFLLNAINDPNSRVVGSVRAAVHVYATNPITGLRTLVGPIRVVTQANSVVYPVGVFYCTASLYTLRQMQRLNLGLVLRVYEGTYYADEYPPETESFPVTKQMLLVKWLCGGIPAEFENKPDEFDKYCKQLSAYFNQNIQPSMFQKDERLQAIAKLLINSSWGALCCRDMSGSAILSGFFAKTLLQNPLAISYFGRPMFVTIPFTARERRMIEQASEGKEELFHMLVATRCKIKTVLTTSDVLNASDAGFTQAPVAQNAGQPVQSSPAIACGSKIPDAMRFNLISLCIALQSLGADVLYTDTDSVKYRLPRDETAATFLAKWKKAVAHNRWFKDLTDGVNFDRLPGGYVIEGFFKRIVVMRSKGLVMQGFLSDKEATGATKENKACGSCLNCEACWALMEAKSHEKAVVSGIRPGSQDSPSFDKLTSIMRAPTPQAFTLMDTNFRVQTSNGSQGGMPRALRMIKLDKMFRAARTCKDDAKEYGRVWKLPLPGSSINRTYPPVVRCISDYQQLPWRRDNFEYDFTDDVLDPEFFRLPDDVGDEAWVRYECELERFVGDKSQGRRILSKEERENKERGHWEDVLYRDETGLACPESCWNELQEWFSEEMGER